MANSQDQLWTHLIESFWLVLNWLGYFIGLVAVGAGTWVWRRYQKHVGWLEELKRRAAESDAFRAVKAQECQLNTDRIDDSQRILDELAGSIVLINRRLEKQDELLEKQDDKHNENVVVLAEIKRDVSWICEELRK